MFYGLCVTQCCRLVLTGDEIRDPQAIAIRAGNGVTWAPGLSFLGKAELGACFLAKGRK